MLHVITYSTDSEKHKYLKESDVNAGVNIIYLMKETWEGVQDKIIAMINLLSNMDDNDIVLFLDAYDAIVTCGKDEMVEKFLALKCDILISAELNCWPLWHKSVMDRILPPTLNNKYINSGTYMGYVKNIRDMFHWKSYEEVVTMCKITDQHYFFMYFIENHHKVNIKLDHNSDIFQCMFLIDLDEIEFRNKRVYNKVLETYPCVVHFNAISFYASDNTNLMPVFIEKMKSAEVQSLGYTRRNTDVFDAGVQKQKN